jgi:hypothetical protein
VSVYVYLYPHYMSLDQYYLKLTRIMVLLLLFSHTHTLMVAGISLIGYVAPTVRVQHTHMYEQPEQSGEC